MATCDQELCQHWTGHGCACQVLDIERLIDPDCRDNKHRTCVGGPCECACHLQEATP